MKKELEMPRIAFTKEWLGDDIADVMVRGGKFFEEIGGTPLPKARVEK